MARVKTGFILALFVAVVMWINSLLLTWFVLGVIYFFAISESKKLFNVKSDSVYLIAAIGWLLIISCDFLSLASFSIGLILVLISAFLVALNQKDIKNVLPLIYPSLPMFLIYSTYFAFGMSFIFWLIMIVSFTDMASYYVGKKIGKTPFSKSSPNKTIEGVIGGLVVGSYIGALAGSLIGFDMLIAFLTSFFVSLFSIFGDLFESYLKRLRDLKDSGSILNAHGGILDRLDGYLFGVFALEFAYLIFLSTEYL